MKLFHYVLLTVGLGWLTADVCLVVSNLILRETPFSLIATVLDELPPAIGTPISILLWIALLFGWVILIGFGVKPLFWR